MLHTQGYYISLGVGSRSATNLSRVDSAHRDLAYMREEKKKTKYTLLTPFLPSHNLTHLDVDLGLACVSSANAWQETGG